MKRILPLLCMLLLCTGAVFAEDSDQGDQYDDSTFEYKINGAGDQYISISLMGAFPLNFDGHLYTGGAAQLGYRRFLTSMISVGGDAMVGYNPTLGSNIFNFWPVTLAVTFQPSIWRFEFPISLGAGIAFETYSSRKYFPGFALKPELGVYYRFSESWSFGIGTDFLWLPEWYKDTPQYNFDGLFMTASISARYHF
jgi:hypothetical protein